MMVCGLVSTARLAAAVVFLFSVSSLFFLSHSCNTQPGDWLVDNSGCSFSLLKSVFSFEDDKAVLRDALEVTLRPSTNYRQDFVNGPSSKGFQPSVFQGNPPTHVENTPTLLPIETQAITSSEVEAVTHFSSSSQTIRIPGAMFSRLTSPFHIRTPPSLTNPLDADGVLNPAGKAPPGQNKGLDTKEPPKGKDPHDKTPPPPPPNTPGSTTEIHTTSSISTENPTTTTAPSPDLPAITSHTNTKTTDDVSPQTVSGPPFVPPTTIHGGGDPAGSPSTILSYPPTGSPPVLSSPQRSIKSPSSTSLSLSPFPDYTTSLSLASPSFLPPQPSSGTTVLPSVVSSENLSRNIRHSNLAVILGVLIPLIVVAIVVVAFILLRRRISRMRRERDVEERNSFSPVLRNPFEVLQIGRSDMLNMFRISGRTPEPSTLSTLPEEEEEENTNSEGQRNPPSSKFHQDRHSRTSFDPEKTGQTELRDSRYSDSDTSWIWYRPPMAV